MENAYIILHRIYSGKCVPNFVRIASALSKILQETFRFFFRTHCIFICVKMCLQTLKNSQGWHTYPLYRRCHFLPDPFPVCAEAHAPRMLGPPSIKIKNPCRGRRHRRRHHRHHRKLARTPVNRWSATPFKSKLHI